jgi:glucose/arabinose dehydrogenase
MRRSRSNSSTAAALIAALLALGLPACGSASQSPPDRPGDARPGGSLGLKQVGRFDQPVYVTGAPGYPKLLFVVEQPGRVMVLNKGRKLAKPFLDLRDAVGYGGERGLLSIAFPADYARSKRFYVYYTDNAGNIRVDEFQRGTPVRARPASQRKVIEVAHPVNSNHNGGQMQFFDGLLYLGTGDGGSAGDPPNNAQNREELLGKLLRIDPRPSGAAPYSAPSDNPFVGKPGRDEIYSLGLRNPFRFSFDTVSAGQPRIAIGDVGQNQFEELDYTSVAAASGANFGWDAFEGFDAYEDQSSGTADPGGTVEPIFAYSHERGGSCSIIGGYVVRDRALRSLYKRYVYADLCEGQLRSLVPHLKRASNERRLGLAVASPTSFGEDDAHRLYVTSLEGPVFRLIEK